ncbi:MAG: hypothetical protein ABI625_07835 [bacterium]
MNTARALEFSKHETVARDLLAKLLEETERVREHEIVADPSAFEKVLDARAETLQALEQSVQMLVASTKLTRSGGPTAARHALIDLAKELERANAGLVRSVTQERGLIAAALTATDRPDRMASRYAGSASAEAHSLNLVR